MIEENPQEFARKLREQTEEVKNRMDAIIDFVLTSTPEAAWPDDQAPVVGDPGFSSAFLNNRNEGLQKLKEAHDLIERALICYHPPNLTSKKVMPDQDTLRSQRN